MSISSHRHAKYVGTMVDPDGQIHRWTAARKNHPARDDHQCFYQEFCLVGRMCHFKIYAISVLVLLDLYVHQIRHTSMPRTMLFSVPQQDRTKLFRQPFLGLTLSVVLVLTWWVFTPSGLAARYRVAACSTTLRQSLEKIQTASRTQLHSSFRSLSRLGERISCLLPWPVAPRMLLILLVVWTVVATLDEVPQNKKQKVATGLLLDKLHKQDCRAYLPTSLQSSVTDQSIPSCGTSCAT